VIESASAIRDLSEASRLDPKDTSVRSLLIRLRSERAKQRSVEKGTFSGMFGRGEIYEETSDKETCGREKEGSERTVDDCERSVASPFLPHTCATRAFPRDLFRRNHRMYFSQRGKSHTPFACKTSDVFPMHQRVLLLNV